jgi:dTDP-4-amino-4,6-dideoxygalactose transaminase
VFSRDSDLIRRIDMRANHGRRDKYKHEFVGRNSRLDGLQAAVLRVKLAHLSEWNAARRQVASWYDDLLAGSSVIERSATRPDAEHVFHLYVVQVEDRDRVLGGLNRDGIGAGVHYPIPVHEQPAYAHLNVKPEALPATHGAARRILSLPIYAEMTQNQAARVADTLRRQLAGPLPTLRRP